MKKYILISADVNDGDYINSKNEITDEELKLIMPVINAINDFNEDKSIKKQKYNWYTIDDRNKTPESLYINTGKCTNKSFDAFSELLPCMETESIHTIESIEILEISNEIKLL